MRSSNFERLAAISVMAGIGLSHGSRAQSPPAFEAASIRRNFGVDPNTHIDVSGGRLTILPMLRRRLSSGTLTVS